MSVWENWASYAAVRRDGRSLDDSMLIYTFDAAAVPVKVFSLHVRRL